MIASLGMYDPPETAAANDAYWAAIRLELGFGPPKLEREMSLWDIWNSPELLFSQTCGMPFRHGLHKTVRLVGTPDYGLNDAPPGYYYSVFLAHADETGGLRSFADQVFAYNDPMSQSGWAAPQNHARGQGFQFRNLLQSGSHRASVSAVLNGNADIAALDAVTWRSLCDFNPSLRTLKIIAKTTPTPGLPFITAYGLDVDKIRIASIRGLDHLSSEHRKMIGIKTIVTIDPTDYLNVQSPEPP